MPKKTSYICGVGSVTGCWLALSDLKNIETNLSKLLTLTTSVFYIFLLFTLVDCAQRAAQALITSS